MDRMKKAGNNLYFVWAGGENKGEPHYYRVSGPDFLIEYDNTQNNANHIHSVWRDLTGDFGADLLKEHYEPLLTTRATQPLAASPLSGKWGRPSVPTSRRRIPPT